MLLSIAFPKKLQGLLNHAISVQRKNLFNRVGFAVSLSCYRSLLTSAGRLSFC